MDRIIVISMKEEKVDTTFGIGNYFNFSLFDYLLSRSLNSHYFFILYLLVVYSIMVIGRYFDFYFQTFASIWKSIDLTDLGLTGSLVCCILITVSGRASPVVITNIL